MSYRYTLVTNFENYWDKLADNQEVSYPLRLLKGDTASSGEIFIEDTPTTFIRIATSTRQPLGVWQGRVHAFRKTTSRVFFKVKIDTTLQMEAQHWLDVGFYVRELSKEETTQLVAAEVSNSVAAPPNGTNPVNKTGIGLTPSDSVVLKTVSASILTLPPVNKTVQSDIRPAIFDELLQTNDWKRFELYTYYLIKLLGIHNAYRFDPANQSGKADGFFKFGNLAVLYDCTLRSNFEEVKRVQIENYCKQLGTGLIEATTNPRVLEEFHHYQKQVWIITRGKSRVIETRNDIAVKEVSVTKLIDLYEYRLRNAFGANQLENELRSIELEEYTNEKP